MSLPSLGQAVNQLSVHVAPSVLRRFQAADAVNWKLAVDQLVNDVRVWKVLGTNGKITTVTTLAFGRDRSNNRDDFAFTWHAHLEPSTKNDRKEWAAIAATGATAFDRTSDRLMVYSLAEDSPKYGCLILGIFGDPGGHRIFDPSYDKIRPKWEIASEKHQKDGLLPVDTVSF